MEDLDLIQKQILEHKKEKGAPEVVINKVAGLFLDASSTCTGYTVVQFEIGNTKAPAIIKSAGVLWFDPDWSHGDKYSYVYRAIVNYFDIVDQTDLIVYEQYSINPKRMAGGLVTPELIGCIKLAATEIGVPILSITPQQWRAKIGLKPYVSAKGKKDFKTPCIDFMKRQLPNYPLRCISNITNKERDTPSDLADSLGVAVGWLKKYGYSNIKYDRCEFNAHIAYEEQLK